MKKTALAIMLGALAFATSASANWYVQGDVGYSKVKFSEYSSLGKSKFEPRLSAGYDFGDWRLAIDYTNYGKFSASETFETHTGPEVKTLKAKIHGFGVSALYDFALDLPVKPYAGVRLATNSFKVENTGANFFHSQSNYKFGYGAIVGAEYELAKNLLLNGGVEYNRLGKFEDTSVNQYGLKAGLRYNF